MKRIRSRMPSIGAIVWLTIAWVLLWGTPTWGKVLNGVLLATFIAVAFPMPKVTGIAVFRPVAILILVTRFVWDVIVSGVKVALVALRPGTPSSAVMRIQLRSRNEFILATTAGMTTLIPGSVAVTVHRRTGVIYLHVFDVPRDNATEYMDNFRATVLAQEYRLLRAFSSREELESVGISLGGSRSAMPVAAQQEESDADTAAHTPAPPADGHEGEKS